MNLWKYSACLNIMFHLKKIKEEYLLLHVIYLSQMATGFEREGSAIIGTFLERALFSHKTYKTIGCSYNIKKESPSLTMDV